MNLHWEEKWLEDFDNNIDAVMDRWSEEFEFADLNLGIFIENDKQKLRRFFKTFENADPNVSKHYFKATRYHGDKNGGVCEWTWEVQHKNDFLGLPAKGKTTKVQGWTIHKFRDGKIVLERSLWDSAALQRQLGLPAPQEPGFERT